MTASELGKVIAGGEGVSVEFKEAKEKVPASFYETVVSFANTNGGVILLGVDDEGNVTGVQPGDKVKFLKNIVTAINSPDKINPVLYLNPVALEYAGQTVIAVQVPASSQVHNHAGRIYIREYEVDIDITANQHKIRGLFLKKGTIYTETHIYPYLKMSDLDETLFDKARNLIRSNRNDHPWLTVDHKQMLREAALYLHDYEQGNEGLTLAAALIFGKDLTIQNLLPAYKVEAMVRIKDKDRWDDRLTLRTNLIDTYLQLKGFINRHLPDKFFMEGDQRVDLRDKIFREVIGNIIIHREYTDATATELIIEEDAVRTLNPNNPRFNGIMDLDNFNPHPKNPNLRRFFVALGWADEIGSGIRNTKKYLPFYVENAKPVFIDESFFRTVIPLVRYTMSDFAGEWLDWLELDEKWLPRLTASLSKIEIDGQLQKMSWEEQISFLSLSWIEKVTKLYREKGTSRYKKVYKSEYHIGTEYQQYNFNEGISSNEKGYKLDEENRPSPTEKVTKLLNKKIRYLIAIMLVIGSPLSIEELMDLLVYNHKGKFRENYLKPLEAAGLITKTTPDKPTAPNQKYVITEKGKRFLTGQDF
ncbi:MAG: putative DNA binding domain-containing protein [Tannerella sp.]|nr:putative DNA binding domain-containing protein [Tannerella sp.]